MQYVKKHSKTFLMLTAALCLSALFFSSYCSAGPASASTAYADSSQQTMPKESVTILEQMQNANRQVAKTILPSVVTLSVTETKKMKAGSSWNDFLWYFFGQPNQGGESPEREYKTEGQGSGVIVRKVGNTYYVLTNQHVAGESEKIVVTFFDGKTAEGKLVGGDQQRDIALVSFESDDKNIRVASLGDSDMVEIGDIVFAVGSPLGYVSSVTQGIVSAVGRSGGPNNNINDFIQTDAAINQGNSGGPLVNIYGQVIGINTWIASSSGGFQGLGFSIPVNNIKPAIDSLITDGKLTYGWVGIQLIPAEKAMIEALGISNDAGALATDVFLNSPAYKGGIRPGDFVIRLNGKDVKNVNQLVLDVGSLPRGSTADFTVIRDAKELSLKVLIEERKQETAGDPSKVWPGFIAYPLTDDIKKELKLQKNQEGVAVSNIRNKSPAAAVGLLTGDVIVAVNDVPVNDLRSFYRELAKAKKNLWFDVVRDGQTLSTLRYKF